MRSDKVDREETLRDVVADFCDMYTELAKGVESGTLDENNLRILRYNDLTSNTDLTWWDELLDWLRLQANRLPQQSSRHHRSLFVRLEPRQLAPTAPTPEIASAIVGVRNARRPFVSAIRDTLGKEL